MWLAGFVMIVCMTNKLIAVVMISKLLWQYTTS